jgi:diguanylate cyclase (GGDEF)-like protein
MAADGMSDHDLFHAEEAALAAAMEAHARECADAADYQGALGRLIEHYARLMRETRRLIRHADRQEGELSALNLRLRQLADELDYKARHDPLTGELNRGAVIDLVRQCLQRAPLSLIVLDIDHFKAVNDGYGHPVGDAVIVELVQRLRSVLPEAGRIGRVGGEEFTVLLPDTDLSAAATVAESMRRIVAENPFDAVPAHHVSASFGVSWSPCGADFEQAYGRADELLYVAKRNGRNQVVSAPRSESSANEAGAGAQH